MKDLMKKLFEVAAGREIAVFETDYGSLHVVKGCNLRMECHFKSEDYCFAMILDENNIIFEAQF